MKGSRIGNSSENPPIRGSDDWSLSAPSHGVKAGLSPRPEGFRGTILHSQRDACRPTNQTPLSLHVCHRQCGCEPPLDKEVETISQVRSRSAEDVLSERLGRSQPLKGSRVRIADDLEYLIADSGRLVLCRDPEGGRECDEIWHFIPFRESADGQIVNRAIRRRVCEAASPGDISS